MEETILGVLREEDSPPQELKGRQHAWERKKRGRRKEGQEMRAGQGNTMQETTPIQSALNKWHPGTCLNKLENTCEGPRGKAMEKLCSYPSRGCWHGPGWAHTNLTPM